MALSWGKMFYFPLLIIDDHSFNGLMYMILTVHEAGPLHTAVVVSTRLVPGHTGAHVAADGVDAVL